MTEALAMPQDHYAGRWTVDEVLALPEDGMRRELVEGRLVESPVPAKPHQMAGKRLEKLLDDFAPLELEAAREINLRFEADLLIPDVMVAATEVLAGPGHFVEPADVVIVVEILSPGNSKFERAWNRDDMPRPASPSTSRSTLSTGRESRSMSCAAVTTSRSPTLLPAVACTLSGPSR